ncbi:class I SAM-dependent methyltransferase [Prauserella sp. ASG 168]|uniref:Class I SAM-dependent methyltransferase n=1 Tax=Prauserella cavernicola TaxID=2800127 RepID=A0A934QXD0_9PSEU|nr:class I SAM-dependent methyltransferase [Prauserella cavernicola]
MPAEGRRTVPKTDFDSAYTEEWAPWIIGEPQPAVVRLERDGWITGAVLDPGCGTGEHTIHLARLGYDVRGIDFSQPAVDRARANAKAHGVRARIDVADALHLGTEPRYDTVVDSALFHVFGDADRAAYVASLHAACVPGARVHVLALSDTEPGLGPRISDSVLRDAFGEGWELEALEPARYRVTLRDEDADRLGLPPGKTADMAAWLARARRV